MESHSNIRYVAAWVLAARSYACNIYTIPRNSRPCTLEIAQHNTSLPISYCFHIHLIWEYRASRNPETQKPNTHAPRIPYPPTINTSRPYYNNHYYRASPKTPKPPWPSHTAPKNHGLRPLFHTDRLNQWKRVPSSRRSGRNPSRQNVNSAPWRTVLRWT